jgi:hypothetical protein
VLHCTYLITITCEMIFIVFSAIFFEPFLRNKIDPMPFSTEILYLSTSVHLVMLQKTTHNKNQYLIDEFLLEILKNVFTLLDKFVFLLYNVDQQVVYRIQISIFLRKEVWASVLKKKPGSNYFCNKHAFYSFR